MAYLVFAEKLAEDESFVEYTYHGSGWDTNKGAGRFKIDKVTQEITVTQEQGYEPSEKLAERGIVAVLKHWRQSSQFPAKAEWAS